jgi:hypothetical protein
VEHDSLLTDIQTALDDVTFQQVWTVGERAPLVDTVAEVLHESIRPVSAS